MSVSFLNAAGRDDLALGLLVMEGVRVEPAAPSLEEALTAEVARRAEGGLDPEAEAWRKAGRRILRNGVYRPTGRGKPASEYLLRAAREGAFPRINGPVDANNLVSLAHVLPISVWDLDRVPASSFEFRLGREGERHVFNQAGQELDLQDLLAGCARLPDRSQPLVTPVKDGLATKLGEDTTRLAGVIYYPLDPGTPEHLESVTQELLGWLLTCGPAPSGSGRICLPGQEVELASP